MSNCVILSKYFPEAKSLGANIVWNCDSGEAYEYWPQVPKKQYPVTIKSQGNHLEITINWHENQPHKEGDGRLFPVTFSGEKETTSDGGVRFVGVERNQSGWSGDLILNVIEGVLR